MRRVLVVVVPGGVAPPYSPVSRASKKGTLIIISRRGYFGRLVPPSSVRKTNLTYRVDPGGMRLESNSRGCPVPVPRLRARINKSVDRLIFVSKKGLGSFRPSIRGTVRRGLVFRTNRFEFIPSYLPKVTYGSLYPVASYSSFSCMLKLETAAVACKRRRVPILGLMGIPGSLLSLYIPRRPARWPGFWRLGSMASCILWLPGRL